MNPRSTKQDTEDQKDTFKEKLGTRVFDLKKDCSEAPLGQKGARKERERAQRARALKGETLSAKFLETALSLKGFIFRDDKTPGSGICRNRSGRPRHKSCLPRRTVLVVLRVPARAPLVFRLTVILSLMITGSSEEALASFRLLLGRLIGQL